MQTCLHRSRATPLWQELHVAAGQAIERRYGARDADLAFGRSCDCRVPIGKETLRQEVNGGVCGSAENATICVSDSGMPPCGWDNVRRWCDGTVRLRLQSLEGFP